MEERDHEDQGAGDYANHTVAPMPTEATNST